MPSDPPSSLTECLERFGQGHVLRWWPELDDVQRRTLSAQIDEIDFDRLARLRSGETADSKESPADLARRADPPRDVVRLPQSEADRAAWREAERCGRELLAVGKVAALVVAGGQGTRLGFPHPKGMYPIGPVSGHSLFQILAEQVLARSWRAGARIPYLVMTSDATHAETATFFEDHGRFGLPREDVHFFPQGNLPALDAATGRLLLAEKGALCLAPDGHGGLLAALRRAGLVGELRRRGVEHVHYHQVDNPAARVCDPGFLGLHLLRGSDLSTKAVVKVAPGERMGVLVEVDGRTRIIEYSDLPDEVARQTEPDGSLRLWAGNTAMHVFRLDFLEQLVADPDSLPLHVARKPVPHLNDAGELVTPDAPNAHKLERFIFDALPLARHSLVVEGDRPREFLPVKNADGIDSPQTCRDGLCRLHAGWLRAAGHPVPDGAAVEIGPLFALDEDEMRTRGSLFDGRVFLS